MVRLHGGSGAAAVTAASALALGDSYRHDVRVRVPEVPEHFRARFPGGTHRAPAGPPEPGRANRRPIPSGTPPLCNRNGLLIRGTVRGGECVKRPDPGGCFHDGQRMTVHRNVTNPGLLETDTGISPEHRYHENSFITDGILLPSDTYGNCLPAPIASATGPSGRAGRHATIS